MKTLHIDMGTGWRGGQQQVLWLMEGLRSLGHEQKLMAPASSPLAARVREKQFEVLALASPSTSLGNIQAVRRASREVELVHAHDSRAHSLAWLARVATRSARPRLVVSRRVAFSIPRYGVPKYAGADAYIAISEYVAQELLKIGVPDSRIHVVWDGVRLPRPAEPEAIAGLRCQHGASEDTVIIGTLTSLAPEKLLKEEVALLAELPPQIQLWIGCPESQAGGEASEELLRVAQELGVDRRFRIVPLGANLGAFLGTLDIFVYLNKSEGLGSAILLAMAHGLPVIASRVGGIPEIVYDHETGLLIHDAARELPAAVRLLLESGKLRSELGRASRQFVMQHATTEIMVNKTAAVYEHLMRNQPRDGAGRAARRSVESLLEGNR